MNTDFHEPAARPIRVLPCPVIYFGLAALIAGKLDPRVLRPQFHGNHFRECTMVCGATLGGFRHESHSSA